MPSLINELALADIKDLVDSKNSIILVDAAGLKAAESLKFRRELKDVGATMRVAKTRLVARAVPEDLRAYIEVKGSLALVATDDVAAAAKVVDELAKTDRVQVRGGLVEGQAVDAAGAAKLADLPTKDQARASLIRLMLAPAAGLIRLLNAPKTQLVKITKAASEKDD